MDRSSFFFWSLIALLLSASMFFGLNAEQRRKSVQVGSGRIDSGDLVRLVKVVDGDTVQVVREGQEPVTVRLIGIKSFDAKVERDVVTPFGRAAVEALSRTMADRPVRVMLNAAPKDKKGRYLATLYAEDQDIALHLVRKGLVMVYTVYPFPSMQLYLQEQEQARTGRRGLWASAAATERAMAMANEWRRQNQ
jgi:Micrococcal nuclease (thermonuclease) homologs